LDPQTMEMQLIWTL